MYIKTYWGVLYEGNHKTGNNKILRETKSAPRHNLLETYNNIVHKGHSCVLLFNKKGSITVEASFCVPIFFLALFSLFYIFVCLYRINCVEDSLTDCAREYAVSGTKTSSISTLVEDKVLIRYDENTRFPVCYVSYNIGIPFLGSQFFKLGFYQQTVINDYSGKSMADDGSEDKNEEYVYIAKSGKVYHPDRGCTYLKPGVKEVQGRTVAEKRNSSGAKYKPCERCCKKLKAENMASVYITSYGDRYHNIQDCPGIKRNVRRVKKSETGSLPACSKCGNKMKRGG